MVLPSVREQFGQVLVEGMACGLPVIAKDAYGPAEIVDHGETGWLVPPDDEEALADALVDAVNDPGKRARKGEAAYARERASATRGPRWPANVAEVYERVRSEPYPRRACRAHSRTRIRRSDRARRARIVVDADGVEVVVPRRMALRHVEPFVAEKQPLDRADARALRGGAPRGAAAACSPTAAACPTWASGSSCACAVEPGRTRPHVARRGERLTVKVGDATAATRSRDALERWYRKRAREEVARAARRRDRARRHATGRGCRSAASARAGRAARRTAR